MKKIGPASALECIGRVLTYCLPQLKATRTKRKLGLLELVSGRISPVVLILKRFTGFYSLFSVTEEPFVTSGGEFRLIVYQGLYRSNRTVDQWMGFYWKDKKDQVRLITKLHLSYIG